MRTDEDVGDGTLTTFLHKIVLNRLFVIPLVDPDVGSFERQQG